MGTIIKDLIILNDEQYNLTKQDKTIKNDYNVIGKSYNKKEKYKTQLSNYEINFEYILNKNDKNYFFNLLNNNNYFLYKNNNNFNSSLIYSNSISYLYIDINDIKDKIDVFSYVDNNRFYCLIDNKKYSFKFDENYDYQLNGLYKFIDEISNNVTNSVVASICYQLDLCILVNNSISFKHLTDTKYNLSFTVETINNIISELGIVNSIPTNDLIEGMYEDKYNMYKDILYTRFLKLDKNHYFLINSYTLIDSQSSAYYPEKHLYVYIEYKRMYINDNNEIESEDSFYSLLDFNERIKFKNIDIGIVDKNTLFKYIDFNVILDNNEIYINFSTSHVDYIYNNYKTYNEEFHTFEYKKSPFINNILTNSIEYLKFEITDKKLNIVDYKKTFFENLVDYKKIQEKDFINGGWGFTTFDDYQYNIHSNMYIYNNMLYTSNFLNSIIISNSYNKNTNEVKKVNESIMDLNSNYNYRSLFNNVSISDVRYNYYFRAKIEDIDYKIKNKSSYYEFSKSKNWLYKNENNILEQKEYVNNNFNKNLLMPDLMGFYGIWNNKNTIQKVLNSNNKKVFFNWQREGQGIIWGKLDPLFKNMLFLLNDNNVLNKINTINFSNGIINDFNEQCFLLNCKDNIKFYYNNITNKYVLFVLTFSSINHSENCNLRLFEFEYNNNDTINITNIIDFNNWPIGTLNTEVKYFNVYFDEIERQYYINLKFNTWGNGFKDTEHLIRLNEDYTYDFNIKRTVDRTY